MMQLVLGKSGVFFCLAQKTKISDCVNGATRIIVVFKTPVPVQTSLAIFVARTIPGNGYAFLQSFTFENCKLQKVPVAIDTPKDTFHTRTVRGVTGTQWQKTHTESIRKGKTLERKRKNAMPLLSQTASYPM